MQDSTRIITGGFEPVLRLYDTQNPSTAPITVEHPGGSKIRKALFGRDGRCLYTGDEAGTVRLWDVRTMSVVRQLDVVRGGQETTIMDMELSDTERSGPSLTVAGGNVVAVLDSSDLSKIARHTLPYEVQAASLHPSHGKYFITGSTDTRVHVHDVASGLELSTQRGHHGRVHAVRFSPQGDIYSSGSDDATIRLWKFDEGEFGSGAPAPASSPVPPATPTPAPALTMTPPIAVQQKPAPGGGMPGQQGQPHMMSQHMQQMPPQQHMQQQQPQMMQPQQQAPMQPQSGPMHPGHMDDKGGPGGGPMYGGYPGGPGAPGAGYPGSYPPGYGPGPQQQGPGGYPGGPHPGGPQGGLQQGGHPYGHFGQGMPQPPPHVHGGGMGYPHGPVQSYPQQQPQYGGYAGQYGPPPGAAYGGRPEPQLGPGGYYGPPPHAGGPPPGAYGGPSGQQQGYGGPVM